MIKYVPAEADGAIAVDVARLVALPHFTDLRKDDKNFAANWKNFESELQKYGLKTGDLPSSVMIFFEADASDQKQAGILAVTKITEAKLVELLKANDQKLTYKTEAIAGRKAYIVTQKADDDDKVAVTYIKPDLVLICDQVKAEKFFAEAGKKMNEKLIALNAKADSKALAYVLFTKKAKASPKAAQANPMGGNPLDKMESAVVVLDITGKAQKDVSLKADLNCADTPAASQLAMQLKTFLMIMSMQLGQNPELNKLVTEAVKIDQKDKNIKLNVAITESLITKLKAFAKAKQEQAMPVAAAKIKK